MKNIARAALIIIDMQKGFICPESAQCIKYAASTVPAIASAAEAARKAGIPVIFIKRQYRANGSDVEMTRYRAWADGGRSLTPGSSGPISEEFMPELSPREGDYVIVKPRWSAFFGTELDLVLRRLDVRTVILAGTTTPNCIRTTCYDANSLEYNVVVLTDGTSSQTEEIQRVNLQDMQRMGAVLMSCGEFKSGCPDNLPQDLSALIREREEL